MALLKIKNYDYTITAENVYDDLTTQDWCRMFVTALVGVGFFPESIYRGMKEYAEEFLEEDNNNSLTN